MKPKLNKSEKKVKQLKQILERREREITRLNKLWAEDIAKVRRKNEFTKFQIASIEKDEWPL